MESDLARDGGLEALVARLRRRFPVVARADVDAVRRFADVAGVGGADRIAVVGTNGKSSATIYAGRVVRAAGRRDGATISPHLVRWAERVQLTGRPVSSGALAGELARLARLDPDPPVCFYDLLTVAAALLFDRAGVDVQIFEAGIGGRLDATRALEPQRVVLTGVGLDHVELLGATREAILREKLAVTPPGGAVFSAPLPEPLRAVAERAAEAGGYDLAFPVVGGDWREQLRDLVAAATASPPTPIALDVPGRRQWTVVDGVRVLLDVAHNGDALERLAPDLPPAFVAVVAVAHGRSWHDVESALAGAVEVVATAVGAAGGMRTDLTGAPAGAMRLEDPVEAVTAGHERAGRLGVPLAVFGSTYLVAAALAALRIADPWLPPV